MGVGTLDTDSAALARRLQLQHRLSNFDLNEWILGHTNPQSGENWLDLGCGRGEQSIPFAELLDPEGSVTSVDLSQESLSVLEDEARARGLADRIITIQSDLDRLSENLSEEQFDGVVGSYSLYYASDPEGLFETIQACMAPKGRVFFCGPTHSNNMELRRITAEARQDERPLQPTKPSVFMEDLAPTICRRLLRNVEVFEFANAVHFPSAADLICYWRSHNLFEPAAEERFVRLAEDHFRVNSQFTNTKRGVGVRATKDG